MDKILHAYDIARNNLRECYGKYGIFAGLHHFKDYWARDSLFASFGALALNDHEIVKNNLELFLKNLHGGQIPLRIGKTSLGIGLSYLGFKNLKRDTIYHNDKSRKKPVDQNSLLVIAFYEYIKKTRDYEFLKHNLKNLESAISWNLQQASDLIKESEYCNWADSVKKKGFVLYTNVCHCHALKCMTHMYDYLGYHKKSTYFRQLHNNVKKKINELFWAGEQYLDWIDGEHQYNYFSTDGNLLAVLWDIADNEKSRHIEEASHIFDINEIPSQCVHPKYPGNLISGQVKLIGLADYHNGLSWLWLGCINALAKNKMGMKKEAHEILNKMSGLIIKSRAVYEVYEKTGRPVKRLIYKAEHPFAWSAGMFVYAVKVIIQVLLKDKPAVK